MESIFCQINDSRLFLDQCNSLAAEGHVVKIAEARVNILSSELLKLIEKAKNSKKKEMAKNKQTLKKKSQSQRPVLPEIQKVDPNNPNDLLNKPPLPPRHTADNPSFGAREEIPGGRGNSSGSSSSSSSGSSPKEKTIAEIAKELDSLEELNDMAEKAKILSNTVSKKIAKLKKVYKSRTGFEYVQAVDKLKYEREINYWKEENRKLKEEGIRKERERIHKASLPTPPPPPPSQTPQTTQITDLSVYSPPVTTSQSALSTQPTLTHGTSIHTANARTPYRPTTGQASSL